MRRIARKLLSPIYKVYERRLLRQVRKGPVPNHLAVIMDGNRRYAESLGLPTYEGHIMGKGTLEELSEWSRSVNIRYLTVYAFSLENFHREEEELTPLMDLFAQSFLDAGNDPRVHENKVRVRALGHREMLPKNVIEAIEYAEDKSSPSEDNATKMPSVPTSTTNSS